MSESKQAPREFYVWPKRKGEFFGSILSIEDFESAINPHCRELSFKAIEYSAYESEKQKVTELVIQLKKVLNQANILENFRDPAVFVETDKLIKKYGGSNEA